MTGSYQVMERRMSQCWQDDCNLVLRRSPLPNIYYDLQLNLML